MFEKALKGIGLNTGEAKVYLACLSLGTQDANTIAKETGFSRYDTILVLSSLLERGFVSKFSRDKDYFTAENPDILLKILENNKFKLVESIELFKKTLPKFEEYVSPAYTKPEIAFYQGKEGIVAAYEDTLTSRTDILAIASVDDTENYFPKYVPKYYKRRKAAGIFIKAIFPDSEMARSRQKKDKEELRVSRLIPKELLQFHIEMNIYDDKVAYFSIVEELAVIVKSKVITDSMRNVFNLCWKMAKIYQENVELKALQNKKEKKL